MLKGSDKNIQVDEKEVFRYMGYRGTSPEPEVLSRIRTCIEEVFEVSELRGIYDVFDKKELSFKSKDLEKNLKECHKVYLMGATIGIGIDRLIVRASVTDIMAATIYQAVGAAYIEAYCDEINDEIRELARKEGMLTRPRFSPGYGDLDLDYQREIFRILNLPKHVGISLTDSLLMTPSKSVTAIIGVCNSDINCQRQDELKHNCKECNLKDCPYRRID